jgi:hypothetical protein
MCIQILNFASQQASTIDRGMGSLIVGRKPNKQTQKTQILYPTTIAVYFNLRNQSRV